MTGLPGAILLAIVMGFAIWGCACSQKNEPPPQESLPNLPHKQSISTRENEEAKPGIVQVSPPKVILNQSNNKGKGTLLRLNLHPGVSWLGDISADISASFDPGYLLPSESPIAQGRFTVSLEAKVKEVEGNRIRIASRSSQIVLTPKGEDASPGSYPEQEAEVVVDNQARLLARELGIFRWIHYVPYLPFPLEEVGKNARWSVESAHSGAILVGEEMALPADYTLQETYVLEGARRYEGREVWEVKGEAVSSDKKFRAFGTYYVDVQTGLVIFARVKQEASVEAPYPQRGKVPATFTGTIIVRAKIREPRPEGH